jgi:hypothetical protein
MIAGRLVQANEYQPKTVNTGIDPITFNLPPVRESRFYPPPFEKGWYGNEVSAYFSAVNTTPIEGGWFQIIKLEPNFIMYMVLKLSQLLWVRMA